MTASLFDHLDRLAQYAHERFRVEMAEARRDYLRLIGANPDNEEYYEEVMKAYLDWFLFDRPLEDSERTPLGVFLEECADSMTGEECGVYAEFLRSRHGLFLIRKVHPESVECADLFTDEKLNIAEDNPAGFFKGEIFDARIIPFHGELRFGELIRFHPARASRLIRNVVKDIRSEQDDRAKDLYIRLAQCKIKQYLFPRVDPIQFYKELL